MVVITLTKKSIVFYAHKQNLLYSLFLYLYTIYENVDIINHIVI